MGIAVRRLPAFTLSLFKSAWSQYLSLLIPLGVICAFCVSFNLLAGEAYAQKEVEQLNVMASVELEQSVEIVGAIEEKAVLDETRDIHAFVKSSPAVLEPLIPEPLVLSPEEEIIAAAEREGCPAVVLIELWRTETGPGLTVWDGEQNIADVFNARGSGAYGPYQFMPGTWVMYAEPEWQAESVYDSARAACIMLQRLHLLEQPTEYAFVRRWTGQDGGLIWSYSSTQASRVWRAWKNI